MSGLLSGNMFSRMLEAARRNPGQFPDYASRLFSAMSTGGDIDFESVGLVQRRDCFDNDEALPLEREEIRRGPEGGGRSTGRKIDPSILGTLFERGLDPGQAFATRRALYRQREDRGYRRSP